MGTQPVAEAAPGSPAAVAVKFAISQLGKPYRWGADGPRSFDCSGLVQTAYRPPGSPCPRCRGSSTGPAPTSPYGRQRSPANC